MKLLGHRIEKRPGDTVAIHMNLRDRMRRPVGVEITCKNDTAPFGTLTAPVVDGMDSHEAFGLLSAFAEVAWDMGWRPRGLEAAMAGRVRGYKIPPLEGT